MMTNMMRTSLKKILLRFHTNDSCSWIRHFGFVRRLVKYHHRMERMWVLQAVAEDDDDLVISSNACCVLWCEKYCCLFAAAEENRQRPSAEFQCICLVVGFHCILSSHSQEVSISHPTFEEDIKNYRNWPTFLFDCPWKERNFDEDKFTLELIH